jgi:hypothetical protein
MIVLGIEDEVLAGKIAAFGETGPERFWGAVRATF